jgi:hypothetical protein
MRLLNWFWNTLAGWQIRYEIWQFGRRSVPATVTRSCGHVEDTRLKRKDLLTRMAWYESMPCAECNFHAIMAETTAVRRRAQLESEARDGR